MSMDKKQQQDDGRESFNRSTGQLHKKGLNPEEDAGNKHHAAHESNHLHGQ